MADEPLIYQLHIELDHISPPIWRRVLVPASTTMDVVHLIVQAAMGWANYHLHQFTAAGQLIGPPDSEATWWDDAPEVIDERTVKLVNLLKKKGHTLGYEYDFGDSWSHTVRLEAIVPCEPGRSYPVCIAGERSAPPEDVGGPWGYVHFLEVMADPNHPEHQDRVDWIGSFDPEALDIDEVNAELQALSQ